MSIMETSGFNFRIRCGKRSALVEHLDSAVSPPGSSEADYLFWLRLCLSSSVGGGLSPPADTH